MSLQPQRDVAAALDALGFAGGGDPADARCLGFFHPDDSSSWPRLQLRRAALGGIKYLLRADFDIDYVT
jgi:hypothetical protein